MEPTLFSNNVLLTERISRRLNKLQRGDIVVSKSPEKPQQNICKRIIGMPGDKIYIKPKYNINPFADPKSVVSTEKDHDPNAPHHQNNRDMTMKNFLGKEVFVPRGHVWLEGDNFENSADSRIYGPVPMGLIQSRILLRVWPLNEVKLFISI